MPITCDAEQHHLNSTKAEFLSVATHEMRTPLTTLGGYVEMLMDGELGPLTDEQREVVEMMHESVQRLKSITSNLNDAFHIAAGRVELLLQPTDLYALLRATVTDLEPQLEAKAQRLTLHVTPALPLALCDELRATQITGTLVGNASKYSPPGGQISVGLRLAEEAGFVQLTVTDAGAPSPQDRAVCSGSFRIENIRLNGVGGRDLGLYVTRSLVELHGGKLWFESKSGTGCVFHVTFPIAERLAVTANEVPATAGTRMTYLKGE